MPTSDEPTRKQWYHEQYLQSDWWKKTREERLRMDGYRCSWCGSEKDLNVHHYSYDYLGCEDAKELITLCEDCHDRLHECLNELGPIRDKMEEKWQAEASGLLRALSSTYKRNNAYMLALSLYYISKGKKIQNMSAFISAVRNAIHNKAGEEPVIPPKDSTSTYTLAAQILSCLRKPKEKRPEEWMVKASKEVREIAEAIDCREFIKFKKR